MLALALPLPLSLQDPFAIEERARFRSSEHGLSLDKQENSKMPDPLSVFAKSDLRIELRSYDTNIFRRLIVFNRMFHDAG